ncbi:MAG: hypothetical protein IKI69_04945 [Oscillospiraceae bacterium]|nr:hypothetical protein [Oscillospiraceae bacterium]
MKKAVLRRHVSAAEDQKICVPDKFIRPGCVPPVQSAETVEAKAGVFKIQSGQRGVEVCFLPAVRVGADIQRAAGIRQNAPQLFDEAIGRIQFLMPGKIGPAGQKADHNAFPPYNYRNRLCCKNI